MTQPQIQETRAPQTPSPPAGTEQARAKLRGACPRVAEELGARDEAVRSAPRRSAESERRHERLQKLNGCVGLAQSRVRILTEQHEEAQGKVPSPYVETRDIWLAERAAEISIELGVARDLLALARRAHRAELRRQRAELGEDAAR